MKILLFGSNGQVGWEAQRSLACLGDVMALDQDQVDFHRPEKFRHIIADTKPDVIVNAAAYTAVDRAETEIQAARTINATAPGELASLARKFNLAFIHFSTDYVYDGIKGSSYTEMDQPNPINVYGQTKLEGDLAIQQAGGAYLILRTSWVYSLRGDSFVRKVLAWARSPGPLRMVADQVGSPTWARLLAEVTAQLLSRGKEYIGDRAGLYHLAGGGFASRLDWARLILALDPIKNEQKFTEMIPAKTFDFPTPARRPLFSALRCEKFSDTFDLRLPPWEDALRMVMDV